MLTTSLQRTLITFLWFSHNKALTATEDMSFNLLRQITVLRINILTDGYTVPWNYAVNTKTSMSDTCRSPPRWGVFKRPKLLMWLIFQYWRLVAVSTKTHLLCEETWSLKYLMAIKYNILGNWVASDLHQHVPEEVKINIRFYNLTYPTTWILKWNNNYIKILGSKYIYQQNYDSIIALFLNNYFSHWELNDKTSLCFWFFLFC